MYYMNQKFLGLTIILFFIGQCLCAQSEDILNKGDLVPNFTEVDEHGNEINLTDYRGKVVLLNFTATWCGPCWETYTPMEELQNRYNDDLIIISFHLDDMKKKWKKKAASKGIEFDVISIWDSENKKDIMNSFAPDLFPNFVLLDKDGIIKKKWTGNSEKHLRRNVHQAMRKF